VCDENNNFFPNGLKQTTNFFTKRAVKKENLFAILLTSIILGFTLALCIIVYPSLDQTTLYRPMPLEKTIPILLISFFILLIVLVVNGNQEKKFFKR